MFVLMNSNTQTEACKLCAQISMLFLEMILQTSILGLFLIKGGGGNYYPFLESMALDFNYKQT